MDQGIPHFVARKKLIKSVHKCSKSLKPTDNDMLVFVALDPALVSLVKLLLQGLKNQPECVKSPSHLAFPTQKKRSKRTAWSLIKKVLQNKGIKCEGEVAMTQIKKIDTELAFLRPTKKQILDQQKCNQTNLTPPPHNFRSYIHI
ncbi:hypothetical protein CDL12_27501 [Handroanthus impetiginosus]|uniref:Uncharacterized protein n=1 Tax=Handroanthus impetiginosus TaxID=429701 RepID=A0A2G9G3W7_9LAMI|nr:hypothetical protein CDL12_27501 [Handroanthus impetiginosus]